MVMADCNVARRDSLLVFFMGAHQTHASTRLSRFTDLRAPQSGCIRHTVQTYQCLLSNPEGGSEHLRASHYKIHQEAPLLGFINSV